MPRPNSLYHRIPIGLLYSIANFPLFRRPQSLPAKLMSETLMAGETYSSTGPGTFKSDKKFNNRFLIFSTQNFLIPWLLPRRNLYGKAKGIPIILSIFAVSAVPALN